MPTMCQLVPAVQMAGKEIRVATLRGAPGTVGTTDGFTQGEDPRYRGAKCSWSLLMDGFPEEAFGVDWSVRS